MKNKFLITGLATATLLSTAVLTQLSPSVYAATTKTSAEEKQKQDEVLANFDKALEDAIAELKKADTQNDPELAKKVEAAITNLKEEAAKQKKEIEDGFKNGLTVEEAEKAIDDANKKAAEEAKAEAEAKAAQDEFLANYDKALEEAVKELEKAETNSPEEAKAKADTIAALKAASDATRKQIVDGFEKGLTAKQAETLIDKANEKAAEEDKEVAAKEKAAQDEFLANYDKALEEAVKELAKAETNSPEEAKAKADTIAALKAASDETRKQIVEGFKKGLTAKQAEALIDELNKKAAEEDKEEANKPAEQPKSDKVESSNGKEAPVNEVPEFDLSTLETATGTQTQASSTQSAQNQEAPTANTPAGINPRTSANPAQTATNETPAEVPAVAEAPKAQESAKQELPNTGSAEFAVFTPAVLSILAGLGLVAPKGKKEDK
ncbi:LPXTG cell wall anchor domain-containing protein [uncultured Granulicatella sp.]|uniref:LPXTG cell wall anchor domain-containing protein n=1 Tax=uncultured Granulicatella sp. TaxID=316089 RepID=UPI0028DD2C00|nr:LPXTG cell wall anchor domain-containing protein [uncultured Granulicatella sp.]